MGRPRISTHCTLYTLRADGQPLLSDRGAGRRRQSGRVRQAAAAARARRTARSPVRPAARLGGGAHARARRHSPVSYEVHGFRARERERVGGGQSVRKLHALRMAAVIKENRAYRPTGFGANVLAGRIVHGCFVWSLFFCCVALAFEGELGFSRPQRL